MAAADDGSQRGGSRLAGIGMLTMRLIRGTGLKSADYNGFSDPYCKISMAKVGPARNCTQKPSRFITCLVTRMLCQLPDDFQRCRARWAWHKFPKRPLTCLQYQSLGFRVNPKP
jgi:hypothetical protein